MTKKIKFVLLMTFISAAFHTQGNTAVASGSIGKCSVWGHPYTLYNTAASSEAVSSGVTVTVDQNRNIGSVTLNGSGALNFSGTNGITLSGSGSEINCRWDITRTDSHTLVNNDSQDTDVHYQDWGNFMAVPYTGNYRWQRGSGWSASMPPSSSYYTGVVLLMIDNNITDHAYQKKIFVQDQDNICSGGTSGISPTWYDNADLTLNAGQHLGYGAQTSYSNFCIKTQLNATCGNAVLYYDN